MKGMTGYGRAEGRIGKFGVVVEVKSLNHRYRDILLKCPQELFPLENQIRRLAQDRVSRGRIEMTIQVERLDKERSRLNLPLLHEYYSLLSKIKDEFNLEEKITLAILLGFKDIITIENSHWENSYWEGLRVVVDEALGLLEEMRQKEGEVTKGDLTQRLKNLKNLIQEIERSSPQILKTKEERFLQRTKELLQIPDLDEGRFREAVVYEALRSDITEEVVRIKGHLSELEKALEAPTPIGKKMEFLLQEISREINTVGSKANDLQISQKVVDFRVELEKIREQVQNIE